MAFHNPILPGGDKQNPLQMSPQANPLETYQGGNNNGRGAKITTGFGNSERSNDKNDKRPAGRTNKPRGGRRIGGRNGRRGNSNKRPTYTIVPPRGGGGSNDQITNTRFRDSYPTGPYEIQGGNSPTVWNGIPDTTTDRNIDVVPRVQVPSKTNVDNKLCIEVRMLNLNLGQSLSSEPGPKWSTARIKPNPYAISFQILFDSWYAQIIDNTNAARGALVSFNKQAVLEYLDTVIYCYDLLIQLEVIQAWSPENQDFYDPVLQRLATNSSLSGVLDLRIRLRDALRRHVIPVNVSKYIRWIRENKLANPDPSSLKLSFKSIEILTLIGAGINPKFTDSDFLLRIDDVVKSCGALEQQIGHYLSTRCDNIQCIPVPHACELLHREASFHQPWLNIFQNRALSVGRYIPPAKKGEPTTIKEFRSPLVSSQSNSISIAVDRNNLDGLVLSNVGNMFIDAPYGLPLEQSWVDPPVLPGQKDKTIPYSSVWTLIVDENDTLNYEFHPVIKWYEFNPSSTYKYTDASSGTNDAPDTSYVTQFCDQRTDNRYVGYNNVAQAQKAEFRNLFTN